MGLWSNRDWDDRGNCVSWTTESKKDPRFSMSGSTNSVLGAPSMVNSAVLAKEKELGVTAPEDIEVGAWKA